MIPTKGICSVNTKFEKIQAVNKETLWTVL